MTLERPPPRGVRPETAQRYLEVAAELVRVDAAHEPAYAHAVSHIRYSDVASRLSVPRSTLYALWETQHDFWRDLVLFTMTRTLPWLDDAETAGDPPIPPGDERALLDHVRTLVNRAQHQLALDPRLVLRATLMGFPRTPQVVSVIVAWERSVRRRIAHHLGAVLRAWGRTPVAPLDLHDLAAITWMFLDGTVLLGNTDPDYTDVRLHLEGPSEGEEGWSLSAYAVRSLLLELTEPGRADGIPALPPPQDEPVVPAWSPRQVEVLTCAADLFAESLALDPAPDVPRPTGALGHITVSRVARAAGVTRRQIYNVWRSHEDLCRDLIRYLRDDEYDGHFDHLADASEDALEGTEATLTLAVTERLFHRRVAPHPDMAPSVKLALEAHLGNALVREANLEGLHSFEARGLRAIEQLAAHSGARMRPGMTFADLNRLLIVLAKAATTLRHGDPASVRTGLPFAGGRYSTFTIAHHAMVEHSVIRPGPVADELARGR